MRPSWSSSYVLQDVLCFSKRLKPICSLLHSHRIQSELKQRHIYFRLLHFLLHNLPDCSAPCSLWTPSPELWLVLSSLWSRSGTGTRERIGPIRARSSRTSSDLSNPNYFLGYKRDRDQSDEQRKTEWEFFQIGDGLRRLANGTYSLESLWALRAPAALVAPGFLVARGLRHPRLARVDLTGPGFRRLNTEINEELHSVRSLTWDPQRIDGGFCCRFIDATVSFRLSTFPEMTLLIAFN